MLSGYMKTQGLEGMGCGIDTSCGCGMGSLLDPSTWGPSDWLVAAGAALVAWKVFKGGQRMRYRRVIRRRIGEL